MRRKFADDRNSKNCPSQFPRNICILNILHFWKKRKYFTAFQISNHIQITLNTFFIIGHSFNIYRNKHNKNYFYYFCNVKRVDIETITSRKWLTVAIFRKWQDSNVALWIEIVLILNWISTSAGIS